MAKNSNGWDFPPPRKNKAGKVDWWWREENVVPAKELDGLPPRVSRRLYHAGLDTVQKIRDAGPDEILGLTDISHVSLRRIKLWLQQHDEEG